MSSMTLIRCLRHFREPRTSSCTSGRENLTDVFLVLEIGSYSGFSALAWYEATVDTQAEKISTEIEPRMIAATKRTIDKYSLKDRVTLLEGPAQKSIKTCTGTFDIIFVDADKEG